MNQDKVNEIARTLDQLSATLDTLEKAGDGLPAVEKNVVRMRGALHVLQIQFGDLAIVGGNI